MTNTQQSPFAELRAWLAGSVERCRAQRWLGASFRFQVAQDIAADIDTQRKAVASDVYTEEQRNLLNASELDEILADGCVTPDELPKLHGLKKRELLSAARLHTVQEALA